MSTVPFELLPGAIEEYWLKIETEPAVPADRWTLAFNGVSHSCTTPDGVWSVWLIANSSAVSPPPEAIVGTPGTYTPRVECIDDPEVIVRNAPTIVIR